jgi:hypothetical protein
MQRSHTFRVALLILMSVALAAACRARPTPTPEATAEPTATDIPAPTPDLSILYRDDFTDSNSGWPDTRLGNGRARYLPPEHYRLELDTPDSLVKAGRPGAFADFSAETELLVPAAGPGQWRTGLVFREILPDYFYAFALSPSTGGWHVLKRSGESWIVLAEGISPAIARDAEQVNTLRVDVHGSSMTFAVNGQGLATLVDADYAAGDMGYMLETLDREQVHVDVDLLVVRRFDAASVPAAPTVVPIPPTTTPTPTATETPAPGATAVAATPAPTVALQTAVPAVVTAAVATANAAATMAIATANAAATLACGIPGFPVCP